jgi:hypothetical protein
VWPFEQRFLGQPSRVRGAQPSGTDVSPTAADGNGNGTPATIVSGDFTIQMGSYYNRTAASLAGDAEHYNLDVESDGLHIQGGTAKLLAGTAASFRVCSRSSDDTNLLMIVPWSDLAAGGQYCVSDDRGSHTMTLLTVRVASPGSSVMVHEDTWPCAEECWTTTGAN